MHYIVSPQRWRARLGWLDGCPGRFDGWMGGRVDVRRFVRAGLLLTSLTLTLPLTLAPRLQVLQLHLQVQPSACSPTMHGRRFSALVLRPPCFGSADLHARGDSFRW
jgi:hypothetical protein